MHLCTLVNELFKVLSKLSRIPACPQGSFAHLMTRLYQSKVELMGKGVANWFRLPIRKK